MSNPPPEVSVYLKAIARKGGKSTSPAKLAAAKANGAKPCAPGKRRGRPKGSKNKPKSPNV